MCYEVVFFLLCKGGFDEYLHDELYDHKYALLKIDFLSYLFCLNTYISLKIYCYHRLPQI